TVDHTAQQSSTVHKALGTQLTLAFLEFFRHVVQVLQLIYTAQLELDLGRVPLWRVWATLGPLHGLRVRGDLDDPVPGDDLLGLGEGTVDDGGLTVPEDHLGPLRGGGQSLTGQQD